MRRVSTSASCCPRRWVFFFCLPFSCAYWGVTWQEGEGIPEARAQDALPDANSKSVGGGGCGSSCIPPPVHSSPHGGCREKIGGVFQGSMHSCRREWAPNKATALPPNRAAVPLFFLSQSSSFLLLVVGNSGRFLSGQGAQETTNSRFLVREMELLRRDSKSDQLFLSTARICERFLAPPTIPSLFLLLPSSKAQSRREYKF